MFAFLLATDTPVGAHDGRKVERRGNPSQRKRSESEGKSAKQPRTIVWHEAAEQSVGSCPLDSPSIVPVEPVYSLTMA